MADRFTEEQIEEFKEIFMQFADSEGLMKISQLGEALRPLYQMSPAELQDVINEIDPAGRGTLTFPEFLYAVPRHYDMGRDDTEEFLKLCRSMDPTNSGRLEQGQLLSAITQFADSPLSNEELSEMVEKGPQPDADGKLDYEEYLRYLMSI